ncbi:DNA repair protein RecN [Tepidimonas taiwanensis]|uniref:DNA repair protein RecN n=1 Tax=Tepidimonas taiwanensis TaxID=307486 RepID=A0A554X0Y7_9BURK|nr:DNA repair protein RecN [Tepidimonas taiwanensis]MDM7463551.1 DNA repair protein RecN [Tepidimonas taiwanensis]TSE29473.1 DNA repair protein RecN [Tepidimonas taiwanensis]UBQ05872.1 DNA repair protein RecN [Tepidimonas taiwanensis]
MSWLRLAVRDFVIVRALDLTLAPGFTALTGETGAGKSILIDALQLLLGGRADAHVVREGAARAEVAGEFDVPAPAAAWLQDNGFDVPPDEPLLLRRTVDVQGRSRGWINGSPATAAQLRALGEHLVDIHGQHAWQSLTRADAVRELLDRYGRIDTRPLRAAWDAWRSALATLEAATAGQAARDEERDRLQWQIDEVARLAPGDDEWDELNQRHARLTHAQTLIDAARAALAALDDDEAGATRALAQAVHRLREQQHIDPGLGAIADVLEQAGAQIADACRDLQHHAQHTELDPEALAALDERLSRWLALARRYRCPPPELPARWHAWQTRLRELERVADLDALQAEVRRTQQAYQSAAQDVSRARAAAAQRLRTAITAMLPTLGMAGGRVEVRLEPLAEPQASGLERVELLVAGHAGATPRPVAKVASGGELSRLALAIAVETSQLGEAPTLIFDEVDSGIGGAVAHTVGRLMRRLGDDRQVLAVTHLAQVAAYAHHHLRVTKVHEGGATHSDVEPLDGEARVEELARMLGGSGSDVSLAHARELLQA